MRKRALPILLGAGLIAGLASPAHAAGAAVTVSPASGLDPAGATISVAGSGFDANANNGFGIYVGFGWKDTSATWYLNAGAFESVKWVHKNNTAPTAGQDKLNADGTFSFDLTGLKAQYTDGAGNAIDCMVTQCYVVTMAAHGAADRSMDTFTPVTFAGSTLEPGEPGEGGENPGTPGGVTDQQNITTQVTGEGALSLAVAGPNVALTSAARGGSATGDLNKVTVTDTRGTDAGWNLVGQVGDFTSGEGDVIPGANLGWTPSAAAVADGSTGVAVPGPAVSGLDEARTLGSAEGGLSGGIFDLGAALELNIPAGAATGTYTGTLTLTLS
ncbi:putative surface cell wall-binding protein [Actinocorallia herbida]|uniref:Putative surface cell wall-binding protein n=1 Tax=Actinocorallia herbida TaxID=58109 RepID=A0A3N1CSV9_9ACTN|nr:WxL domain-containing protein [Actinocorallia herbida]ROO84402.1 putative surface cell wall-binding protein [Actinocorallia herbida]